MHGESSAARRIKVYWDETYAILNIMDFPTGLLGCFSG